MKKETTYSRFELRKGTCTCCGEETEELDPDEDMCIDCIQEAEFYEETMKGL